MIARGTGAFVLPMAAATGAAAQTAIRIGLADDPEVLDPVLCRLAGVRGMTAIVPKPRPNLCLGPRSPSAAHSAQLKGFISYPDGIFRPHGRTPGPAS